MARAGNSGQLRREIFLLNAGAIGCRRLFQIVEIIVRGVNIQWAGMRHSETDAKITPVRS
jgi:hypothetical protein